MTDSLLSSNGCIPVPSSQDLYCHSMSVDSFHRVVVDMDNGGSELHRNINLIASNLKIRDKYKTVDRGQFEESFSQKDHAPVFSALEIVNGTYVWPSMKTCIPSLETFVRDFESVAGAVDDASCKTTCKHRLNVLEEKFHLYSLLNQHREERTCATRRGGGIYAHHLKVDNSCGLNTCMLSSRLIDFMDHCLSKYPDEPVLQNAHGESLTLLDVCTQLRIADEFSVLTPEGMGLVPTTHEHLQRLESISCITALKGNHPSQLSRAVLDTRTLNRGKFFAKVLKPIMDRNERLFLTQREASREISIHRPVLATEYRFVIHGGTEAEWRTQTKWLVENGLCLYRHARWIIHIPRGTERRHNTELYQCATFQDQLSNIFLPLFEATLEPDAPHNRDLSMTLAHIGAFHVDSEDVVTSSSQKYDRNRIPKMYPWKKAPPDVVFHYFMWSNLCSLNALRASKGLNTIQFRAQCLEGATSDDTLVSSFLLADAITHGIRITQNAALSYLYYLAQIGMIQSPMANNAVHRPFPQSPFPSLFRRGFLVTLATSDPLYYHSNEDPLYEEYGLAMRMFQLTPVDISEIARNSVLVSTFSHVVKQATLGTHYYEGARGHSFECTNLPRIRLCFREDNLREEYLILSIALAGTNTPERVELLRSVRYLALTKDEDVSPPSASTTSKQKSGSDRAKFLESLIEKGFIDHTRVVDTGESFPRIHIVGPEECDERLMDVVRYLHNVSKKRMRYIYRPPQPWENLSLGSLSDNAGTGTRQPERTRDGGSSASSNAPTRESQEYTCEALHGVYVRKPKHFMAKWPEKVPTMMDYEMDLAELEVVCASREVQSFATRRLLLLEHKFNLHLAINSPLESSITSRKNVRTDRDFYKTHKVDTHVHMDTGFTARQLLNFILSKAHSNADDIVFEDHGPVTLGDLLRTLGIRAETLTVDQLNVQSNLQSYRERYQPTQGNGLRTVLLATDNYLGGRYFAELIKLTFEQYKLDDYTFAENRLTLYGKDINEWQKLAHWFGTHGMASQKNRWLLQIPRNYSQCRNANLIKSYGELLRNIFQPLWHVSLDPNSNPKLAQFLSHVSGFDCVGNEELVDQPLRADSHEPPVLPHLWTSSEEPPYAYWMYYLWANLRTLNQFRAERGMSTFSYRPHSGETGSIQHLMSSYLVADAVNHGIVLRRSPVLEYLYYIAQIGIAMSPLSNNGYHLDYLENPFPRFYKRGLNVSLSTDDPLQFHHTQEPLMEEYSIASKIWKLSPNDMCEIARNSVRQSGFPHFWKLAAIGDVYYLSSSRANDIYKTHLSNIRVAYRFETYHSEIDTLQRYCPVRERFLRMMYLPEDENRLVTVAMQKLERTLVYDPANEGMTDDPSELPSDSNTRGSMNVPQIGPLAKKKIANLQRELKKATLRIKESENMNTRLQRELADLRTKFEAHAQSLRNDGSAQSVRNDASDENSPGHGPRSGDPSGQFVLSGTSSSGSNLQNFQTARRWRAFSVVPELAADFSAPVYEEEEGDG